MRCYFQDDFCKLLKHVLFVAVQTLVFVVGGGNYIEYQNLVDYAKVSFHLTL